MVNCSALGLGVFNFLYFLAQNQTKKILNSKILSEQKNLFLYITVELILLNFFASQNDILISFAIPSIGVTLGNFRNKFSFGYFVQNVLFLTFFVILNGPKFNYFLVPILGVLHGVNV